MTFEARPPAKVNLTLEVGLRGEDGYHQLESVFLRVGLSDRLTFRPGDGAEDRLVVGGLPGCPVDGNIVLRALALLRATADRPLPSLDVELDKHIPIAAGLAGGSSDAAAALDLAAAAWGLEISLAERLALAMELGSDVPFFELAVTAALVHGRGEKVTALPPLAGEAGVLLYCPPVAVATTAAYARFDDLGPVAGSTLRSTAELARAVGGGIDGAELAAWGSRLRDANHLWPAAASLVPVLADLRTELESRTGVRWLMSGSGPTLFSLHPTLAAAVAAGKRVAEVGLPREGTLIFVTDLVGPDPAWRYP